jgi:hypothetical protein
VPAAPSHCTGEGGTCNSLDGSGESGGEQKEEPFVVGKVVLGPPDFVRKIEMFRNQGRSRLGKDHLMRHCTQDPSASAEDGAGEDAAEGEAGAGDAAAKEGATADRDERHHKADGSLARASEELKGLVVGDSDARIPNPNASALVSPIMYPLLDLTHK